MYMAYNAFCLQSTCVFLFLWNIFLPERYHACTLHHLQYDVYIEIFINCIPAKPPGRQLILLISKRKIATTYQEYGTQKINYVMRFLYSADLWLKRPDALNVSNALMQFIRAYLLLARLCYDRGENKFACVPKLHAIHEIQFQMTHQAKIAFWILNPMCETCSVDEDLIGRVALLTRRVSPKIIAKRSLARYLAQINILWARG